MVLRLFPLLAAVLVLAKGQPLAAQQMDLSKGNQQWIQYYNQTKLTDKWNWQFDGGFRWSELFQNNAQYILRTGIGYSFNSTISVATGFAHLGFFSNDRLSRMEFRPYQELMLKNPVRSVEFTHRYRVEGRFFMPFADGEVRTPSSFNVRFRYSLMLRIPLFKLSKNHPEMKVDLNIGDELFINAGKGIVYNVFDQNRVIVSPTIHFTKDLAVAFTYTSMFGATTTQGKYLYQDIMWLQIRHKLTVRRKEIE